MTFLEAALEILRRERKPLHYKDITTRAMDKKLLTFVGRTPEVTMQTQLTAAVKKAPGAPFVRVKPGTFGLLRYPEAAPQSSSEDEKEDVESNGEGAGGEGEGEGGNDIAAKAGDARARRRRRGGRGRGGRRDEAVASETGAQPAASSEDADSDEEESSEEPEIGSISAEARAAALAESGVLEALGDDESDEDADDEDDDDDLEDDTTGLEDDDDAAEADGDDEGDEDDDEDDDDEETAPAAVKSGASDSPAASADSDLKTSGAAAGDEDDDDAGGLEMGAPTSGGEGGGEAGLAASGGPGAGPGFEGDSGRRRRRRRRRRGGGEGGFAGGEEGGNGGPGSHGSNGGNGAPSDEIAEGSGEGAPASSAAEASSSSSESADGGASRRIMSPVDAAIEILRGQAPGRGMHVRQLADAATRRRLVHGEANEAWRVMRAALAAEPRERLRAGTRPRVRSAGSGLFALARRPPDLDLERAEHVFGEARRALRERTLAALEQRLVELSPSGFEAITRVLLQREGFGPATFVKRVEGTVYLEALRGRGIRPSRTLIALRPGGAAAGRRSVGELRAGIRARNQDEGVLLLGARLGEDGVAEWKQPGPPIEVADGAALAETCLRHGVGVINAMISVDFVDADFFAELQEG